MYSEWASLQRDIQTDTSHVSVLEHFPATVGRDVATVVVHSLAQSLSLGVANREPSQLVSQSSLEWTMQVLCHGLSLPLSEHETIKDCVNVYCEWLAGIGIEQAPRACVPPPVSENPNLYARHILCHFTNLFVPRKPAEPPSGAVTKPAQASQAVTAGDLVNRQTVFCHRVLRTVQAVAAEWTSMERETWECLLKFLLSINDKLLAPPIVKDGLGEQLCERVLTVLFELWVMACSRHFPSPPLWKTFHVMCANWRHQVALVVQWHRLNIVFTSRIIQLMYGPNYPRLYVAEEDANLVPESLDADTLVQCWFRLLHILGNPVELSSAQLVSNTPKFLHAALTSDAVIDPHQHACLSALQHIFHLAIKGIAALVDAFLGISVNNDLLTQHVRHSAPQLETATAGWTPPNQRKNKSVSVSQPSFKGTSTKGSRPAVKMSSSADTISISSGASLTSLDERPPYAAGRPKVNSILHLFGQWLVEAALVGVKVPGKVDKALSRSRTASFHLQRDPRDSTDTTDSTTAADTTAYAHNYAQGRAEACGALCRIFCSHRTRESVLPVYLARFYIVLHHGLQTGKNMNGQVLASIILNSIDLLRVDLDGVQVLVPQILQALELVIKDVRSRLHYGDVVSAAEVRKASIHVFLSMLCLPLHFKSLPIKPIFSDSENVAEVVTFISLKTRTIDLLLQALLDEPDSTNTQMLLGGLLLCVQDLALCERAEKTSLQQDTESRKASITSNEPNTDSAAGLFGHAASVVCARLMASWKLDLASALAALEVLSGLACVPAGPSPLMCRRTVNWICEFIQYQSSRPAPAHSRDLHSMLCAAFHCLITWLTKHDKLAHDKACLHAVLEVVELGISGSRSQPPEQPPAPSRQQSSFQHQRSSESQKAATKHKHDRDTTRLVDESDGQNRASEVAKLKADKDLKPVSQRVKDAAEQLLTAIMDNVGSFPSPCGPECASSLLDEAALLNYCKNGQPSGNGDCLQTGGQAGKCGTKDASLPLRYFVLDGTTIIGLLEQPLANDEQPLPTVTTLVRGPFGRYAWVMQLRHQARSCRVLSRSSVSESKRPQPVLNTGTHYNIRHRYFPESVDNIPLFSVDKSIPALEETQLMYSDELQKLTGFIEEQVKFENSVADKVKAEREARPFPDPSSECHAPSICLDFQTARLYLSHFNWLSLEALKESPNSCITPSLLMLDSSQPSFHADLRLLDAMPGRTSETVHVFYVRDGQKTAAEILNNVTSKRNVSVYFMEFVRSLGWPVSVKQHAGWTGHVSTSWHIDSADEDEPYPSDTGGSLYDGCRQVLYSADVMSEMAFVVPSPNTCQSASRRASTEPSVVPAGGDKVRPEASERSPEVAALSSKSLSLDLDKPPERAAREAPPISRRFTRLSTTTSWVETKIFVVWLERFEDHENFPTEELLPSTTTGLHSGSILRQASSSVYIIFIHALQNGLYRIHTQGHVGKTTLAVPLVDGMVVSHRSLGSMVRQTASNIYRRKRLENESYQPPHVRRKLKMNEIIEKYHNKLIEPDFYAALFTDNSK